MEPETDLMGVSVCGGGWVCLRCVGVYLLCGCVWMGVGVGVGECVYLWIHVREFLL